MSELSPQAQAVLDAVCNNMEWDGDTQYLIAAALRAAVDQVVPETREHHPATVDERHRKVSAFNVRDQFFAIVAELERAG